jgi:hypothetical protein
MGEIPDDEKGKIISIKRTIKGVSQKQKQSNIHKKTIKRADRIGK